MNICVLKPVQLKKTETYQSSSLQSPVESLSFCWYSLSLPSWSRQRRGRCGLFRLTGLVTPSPFTWISWLLQLLLSYISKQNNGPNNGQPPSYRSVPFEKNLEFVGGYPAGYANMKKVCELLLILGLKKCCTARMKLKCLMSFTNNL